MNLVLLDKLHRRSSVIGTCWLWNKYLDKDGYGTVTVNKYPYRVHRLSLCIFLKLDYKDKSWTANHICNNKNCWNPLHVYQGDRASNEVDRTIYHNRNKTHCPRGHEYNEKNTYHNGKGDRICRECNRLRSLRRFYVKEIRR